MFVVSSRKILSMDLNVWIPNCYTHTLLEPYIGDNGIRCSGDPHFLLLNGKL